MIAHVVLFEPKPDVPAEVTRAFFEALRTTVRAVPEMLRAQVGRTADSGQETKHVGSQMTYSFLAIFEFENRGGLERYLSSPSHDAVREMFWRYCQSTVIADAEMVDVDSGELFDWVE